MKKCVFTATLCSLLISLSAASEEPTLCQAMDPDKLERVRWLLMIRLRNKYINDVTP